MLCVNIVSSLQRTQGPRSILARQRRGHSQEEIDRISQREKRQTVLQNVSIIL